jgi:hypothetical protein
MWHNMKKMLITKLTSFKTIQYEQKNQNIRIGHMTKIITYKLGIFHLTTTPVFCLLSTSFQKQQSDLLIAQFHIKIDKAHGSR